MMLPHNNKGCVVIHMTECAGRRVNSLQRWGVMALAVAVISGCASYPPPLPVSLNHIQAEPQTKASGIPEPVKTSAFVPPPKASVKPQTYSVVVNEVPVKELLFALARDSKLNVDVHPAIQGLVTMNAVNEPLESILERLSGQVSLRYKIEGNTLSITPDSPYMQAYRVDYVNLSRNTDFRHRRGDPDRQRGRYGGYGGRDFRRGECLHNQSEQQVGQQFLGYAGK